MEFTSVDECAIAMLVECAHLSKNDPVGEIQERGGVVRLSRPNRYTSSPIVKGTENTVVYGVTNDTVAVVHTHPPNNPDRFSLNESLSKYDLAVSALVANAIAERRVTFYLGTPSGAIRVFKPGWYAFGGKTLRLPGFLNYR